MRRKNIWKRSRGFYRTGLELPRSWTPVLEKHQVRTCFLRRVSFLCNTVYFSNATYSTYRAPEPTSAYEGVCQETITITVRSEPQVRLWSESIDHEVVSRANYRSGKCFPRGERGLAIAVCTGMFLRSGWVVNVSMMIIFYFPLPFHHRTLLRCDSIGTSPRRPCWWWKNSLTILSYLTSSNYSISSWRRRSS